MASIYILIAVAVVVFVALVVLKAVLVKPSAGGRLDAYYLRKSVFTPAERSFLGVLESVCLNEYRILAKIRLADIFGIKKGTGWQTAFNRISAKHVDFLLVRQSDGTPILGIELDDSSHDEPARKERDRFVDAVFEATGLSILHVPAGRSYDPRAIREDILIAVLRKDMKRSA